MKHYLIFPVLALVLNSGCSTDLAALAADKATACIHESVAAPGWSQNVTIIRSNSDNGSTVTESSGGCTVTNNMVPVVKSGQ